MMIKKFKIKYEDPETQEPKEVTKSFRDSFKETISFNDSFADIITPVISAKEWVEDYAYSLADKGYYTITEVE
jgi:hypothetical protein